MGVSFWAIEQLDLEDKTNQEIWCESPALQAELRRLNSTVRADVLQALVGCGNLPWVPDIVGRHWREPGTVVVVGSAYATFIEGQGGRSRQLSLREYRPDGTAAEFQQAFVRDVVQNDPWYYGPIAQLMMGI